MQIKTKASCGVLWSSRSLSVVASPPLARSADARRPTGQWQARAPAGASVPAGYVIGAEDVLSIVFWRDKEMSAEVVVRPDGKISLPLLNDVVAAGYTPEELRAQLVKAPRSFWRIRTPRWS